jgi:hypothetical protein
MFAVCQASVWTGSLPARAEAYWKGPGSIAASPIPTEQGKISKDRKPRPALQHALHAGLLSDATFHNDFLHSRDLKPGAGTF